MEHEEIVYCGSNKKLIDYIQNIFFSIFLIICVIFLIFFSGNFFYVLYYGVQIAEMNFNSKVYQENNTCLYSENLSKSNLVKNRFNDCFTKEYLLERTKFFKHLGLIGFTILFTIICFIIWVIGFYTIDYILSLIHI